MAPASYRYNPDDTEQAIDNKAQQICTQTSTQAYFARVPICIHNVSSNIPVKPGGHSAGTGVVVAAGVGNGVLELVAVANALGLDVAAAEEVEETTGVVLEVKCERNYQAGVETRVRARSPC